MAPWNARQGDVVCILFGGSVPFVLRQDGTDRWRIVGDVYVQDIMNVRLSHMDSRSWSMLLTKFMYRANIFASFDTMVILKRQQDGSIYVDTTHTCRRLLSSFCLRRLFNLYILRLDITAVHHQQAARVLGCATSCRCATDRRRRSSKIGFETNSFHRSEE